MASHDAPIRSVTVKPKLTSCPQFQWKLAEEELLQALHERGGLLNIRCLPERDSLGSEC